ncbi:MAG TPA: nitroreductase/quinone reductase family protein [Actinomycetota bacterium]
MPGPADLDFGYLTTVGRVTGRPHRIEIWFALHDGTVYLLSGGRERSDWVANLLADPRVRFELGGEVRETTARTLEPGTDEDALARRLLVEKYTSRDPDDLGEWGRTSLPVRVGWDPPQ